MSWSQGGGGGWAPQEQQGHPGWGAAHQAPAAAPAAVHGAGAASPIGFDLQPGEVLLYFRAHSIASQQAAGWIFGILLLPVLIGVVILYFVTRGGKRPGAYAVTSQRVVIIQPGNGWAQSYWLQGVVDLEPVRQNVHVHGGGLVGALVSVAVTAGLDALADRKKKLEHGYWTRASGLTLIGGDGRRQVVDLMHGNGPTIGVTVAHLLAGMHHALRPLDPGMFVGALAPSRPMAGTLQRIVALCLMPAACLFLAEGIRMWGIFGDVAASDTMMYLVVGGAGVPIALALFVWGALAARAANLAEAPPPQPPGAPPQPQASPRALKGGDIGFALGFAALTGVGILFVGGQTADALTSDRSPTRSGRAAQPAGPGATPAPAQPGAVSLGAPSGNAGFDRIQGVLRASGFTVSDAPHTSTMGPAFHGTINTTQGPWIAYWDLACAPRDGAATACFAGPRHGVTVELTGSTPARQAQLAADARALALALIVVSPVSSQSLNAALLRKGYRSTSAPPTDDDFTFAQRTYLFFVDKGDVSATVHVADYARAAARQDGAVVRVTGTSVVLVSAEYGGGVTAADALAAKLAGR